MRKYVQKFLLPKGFAIQSQYNPEFIQGARKLGGKWNTNQWEFMKEVEPYVDDLCMRVYGEAGNSVERVALRVTIKPRYYVDRAPIIIAGRIVARAYGRDSGAELGDGVIVLQGDFTSGGSMKKWDTRSQADENTVAVIYHLPLTKANEVIENLPDGVLEASIEGSEVPAEKDEDVISAARSLGAEFANAKFPKLKEILASVAVKEAEKHPDEDREAFIRQYIRAVFDVFNDLYAS